MPCSAGPARSGTWPAELNEGPNTGSALFREALADVADGVRSVAEADLKDLLAKARIPLPLFNPALYDSNGTFIARPDAWWPELGIAIEVDSREWHLSPEDHEQTLARGRQMGRHQIVVLRFTPKQIRSQAATVAEEIRRTLKGARGRPPLNLRTVPAGEEPGRRRARPGERSRGVTAVSPGAGRFLAAGEFHLCRGQARFRDDSFQLFPPPAFRSGKSASYPHMTASVRKFVHMLSTGSLV